MKKFLITGGVGFIGSHTSFSLLSKGYKLVVIDSLINSSRESLDNFIQLVKIKNPEYLANFNFFNCDIRDKKKLEEIFKISSESDEPIEGVFHFAGLKSVNESVNEPLNYWDVNVFGSISLLGIMKKYGCKTIIFSSSATVYGINTNLRISEKNKINPSNPYGHTKVAIENLLLNLNLAEPKEWKIGILRYFNPIGAHKDGFIGENPSNSPNNIFPIITRVSCGLINELKIYGNNWETFDGTCIRDFIHVMDVAEGHIKTLDYLLNNDPQLLCLNLGTGIGTSVLELVEIFKRVNKVKLPYRFAAKREGDVPVLVADNSRAKTILNWEPKFTLEEMCRDGWAWQKQKTGNN